MRKEYVSTTGNVYTFPVNGKFITISPFPKSYATDDSKMQEAIENSDRFKSGSIISLHIKKKSNAPNNAEKTEYPEITNYQEAADLLKGMKVNANALKNPESINRKAGELGISFPNIKE